MIAGVYRRQIALHVHHDVVQALGVDLLDGFVDAVRTRRMVGAGHHGAAADRRDRPCHSDLVGGHQHRTDRSRDGAPPDMHDHGFARDEGERFAGQPGRRHPGRNENDRVWHDGAALSRSGPAAAPGGKK